MANKRLIRHKLDKERFVSVLKSRRLSIRELSKNVSIEDRQMRRYVEAGSIPVVTAFSICGYLQLAVDYVFGEDYSPEWLEFKKAAMVALL